MNGVYFMSLLFSHEVLLFFWCVCVCFSIVPNVQSLKTKNYFSILLINFTYTQFVNYDLRRYRSTITFHHLLSTWADCLHFCCCWGWCYGCCYHCYYLIFVFFFLFVRIHFISCAWLRFFRPSLRIPVRLLFDCSTIP